MLSNAVSGLGVASGLRRGRLRPSLLGWLLIFDPVEHNRAAWDREVEAGNEWTRPVGPEVIARARKATGPWWLIGYEPTPRDWFPPAWPARRCCAWLPEAASRARCSPRRARG